MRFLAMLGMTVVSVVYEKEGGCEAPSFLPPQNTNTVIPKVVRNLLLETSGAKQIPRIRSE